MKKQHGATLPITLIILLLITIIGIAALQSSLFEEKMSASSRDRERSFEAAETSMSDGQSWLFSLTQFPNSSTNCSSVPCVLTYNPSIYPEFQSPSWWATNGTTVSTTATASLPKYVVEYQRFVSDDKTIGYNYVTQGSHFFRITSQGAGITDKAKTILQGSLKRRF